MGIPIYAGARRGPMLIRLGMLLYDLLSIGKTVPGHEMLSREAALAADPGLRAEGLRAAAAYYDAQVTFAERLVLENLLAARAAGAEVHTYSKVTRIDVEAGAVCGLEFVDVETGGNHSIETRAVVNAAGPWVDSVLDVAPGDTPDLIGGTKGSHIVVSAFPGAPTDAYYVEAESDGRPFFIIPWNGQYLIGTTDIRFDGELESLRASAAEAAYLLGETNRVFPDAGLGLSDIHYAYAGVRPLPRQDRGPASAITRRHIIRHHKDCARGLFSIVGGKLTTYRNLAEQTVDRIARLERRRLPGCRTADMLLPGAHAIAQGREALERLGPLSAAGIERLAAIYGGRARNVAALAGAEPALNAVLDDAATVLAAEVVFAIREEMARTLIDIVYRRLMVGLDADQGRPLYARIADLAAAEFGWDGETRSRALAGLGAYSDSLRGEY
jgi:glycerol-3-phosphate dehydrogenase